MTRLPVLPPPLAAVGSAVDAPRRPWRARLSEASRALRGLATALPSRLAAGTLLTLAASAALAQAPSGRAAGAAEDMKAVQAAALKEGVVSVYHNLRPQGVEQLMSEFRKAHPGIKTEQIRLGSAPLIERFATEFSAGKHIADVVLTFPNDTYLAGVDKGGWALEWAPPEFAGNYPASANRGNRAFAVHTSRNVIIWNKQRVKPADAPKEWADLWDPKWKGKVAVDPPWRSVAVQGLMVFWNKNGLADAPQKLKANDVKFFEGSAGVFQAVLRGDALIGTLADLPLEPALEDGAPIGFVYPKSGTSTNDGYVMVNAKAPHPNAGKLLANWLLSAKGQAVLQEAGGLAVTRNGAPAMKFTPATRDLSNAKDALTFVTGADLERVVETWRKLFGVH